MTFIPRHLDLFLKSQPGRWSGNMTFGKWIEHTNCPFEDSIDPRFLSEKLQRSHLLEIRNLPSVTARDLAAAIFAWGGMKTNHGRVLFASPHTQWIEVCKGLYDGSVSVLDAYDGFYKLSMQDKLPRVGPAYYTKLLFFAPRAGLKRGPIMDQWTARSVNLLTGRPIVRLVKLRAGQRDNVYVHRDNNLDVYSEFCEVVRQLAMAANASDDPTSLEDIEMRLFSEGGRSAKVLPWRAHVVSQIAQTPLKV